MGRKDWHYLHLPKLLVNRLDHFMQTPRAKSMGLSNKSELLRVVVNQYLEQQEILCRPESISDYILEIKDRIHLVITYDKRAQFEEVVTAFINRGIKNNQINILNISKQEEKMFIEAIDNGGINSDYWFNSEEIMIIPSEDCFYQGKFFTEPFVKNLNQIRDLAKKKGKLGLNILSTTPGNLALEGRYDDVLLDEKSTHELVEKYDMPVTVLCLYKSLPPAIEDRLLQCHHVVIKHAITTSETGLQ